MDVGQQSSKQGRIGNDVINVSIDVRCACSALNRCISCGRNCSSCGGCCGGCKRADVIDKLIALHTLPAGTCLGEQVSVVALDAERGVEVGNKAIVEGGGLCKREREHSDQQQGSLHRLIIL